LNQLALVPLDYGD